jgi:hypothetical protein
LDEWRDTAESYSSSGNGGSGSPAARSMVAPASVGEGGGGTSNCLGPAVTWDYFSKVGMNATIHPFEACEGTSAELADWSYKLSTLFLCFFGFFKCVNMITESIGAAKQTKLMSSFDWGNDNVVIKR